MDEAGRLCDTHSHLADPAFDGDRREVLARAARVGVAQIWVVGEGEEDNERVLRVCAEHPAPLRPCLGLFPGRGGLVEARAVADRIREERGRLAAIGEVGLDFRLEEDSRGRSLQEEVLALFARLSLELELPLTVHSRSAGRRTLEVLAAAGARRVIMHAFDGRAGRALEGARAGFHFSIPPSLLRSRQKEKMVRALPLESILLESDAPVLGPRPGERNEPANLPATVERISEIKGVTPAAVARAAAENLARLTGPA